MFGVYSSLIWFTVLGCVCLFNAGSFVFLGGIFDPDIDGFAATIGVFVLLIVGFIFMIPMYQYVANQPASVDRISEAVTDCPALKDSLLKLNRVVLVRELLALEADCEKSNNRILLEQQKAAGLN